MLFRSRFALAAKLLARRAWLMQQAKDMVKQGVAKETWDAEPNTPPVIPQPEKPATQEQKDTLKNVVTIPPPSGKWTYAPALAKMEKLYATASAGNIEGLKAVSTSEKGNHYEKKAHAYKQQLLAILGSGATVKADDSHKTAFAGGLVAGETKAAATDWVQTSVGKLLKLPAIEIPDEQIGRAHV